MREFLVVAAIAVLAGPNPAIGAEIAGKARVIDAGTIDVGSQRVRLYGIDAPSETQTCTRNGAPWHCGQEAAWALAYELAEHWVTCRPMGTAADNSMLATCTIGGAHDVAEIVIRKGWARASAVSPDGYLSAEEDARVRRVGLWQGHR